MDLPWELHFVRAAKYLNVAPWELAEQSVYWTNLALSAEHYETRARNMIVAAHNRKMAGK